MNVDEYITIMKSFFEQFIDLSSAEPLDSKACNDLIERMRHVNEKFSRSRRRRPWAAVFFLISLLLVLLYIVYNILCNLKIMDSQ